jgi:diaminopimelate epimerase
VPDVDAAPVTAQGPSIERHPRFPNRVNAGYMAIVDRVTIRLRVWERGAGETLACGTGACASAVAAILTKRARSPVKVDMTGGSLLVTWEPGGPVRMRGGATHVFSGELDLEALQ